MTPARDRRIALALVLAVTVATVPIFWGHIGPDLTATWMAATFLADSNAAAVYPGPAGADLWSARAGALGIDPYGYLPYIYPPLWAALVAPLTRMAELTTFQNVALVINYAALFGMLALARRTAAPASSPTLYLILGLVVLCAGPFAPLALFHNQPQIVVAFLIVLAIERARAGDGTSAGAALALAAALKVTPVLLLPVLMAAGPGRRIFATFALTGAALALASVALAGWPLHRDFLSMLANMTRITVTLDVAYSLDAFWGQCAHAVDTCLAWTNPRRTPEGYDLAHKGALWRAVSLVLQLAILVLFTRAVRRNPSPMLWVAGLIALTMAGNVAWSYHYLAPLALLPALVGPLGPVRGSLAIVGLSLVASYPVLRAAVFMPGLRYNEAVIGTLALVLTALVAAWAARRSEPR